MPIGEFCVLGDKDWGEEKGERKGDRSAAQGHDCSVFSSVFVLC